MKNLVIEQLTSAEDGLGYDIRNDDYHSMGGISSTDIKIMGISPLHYLNKELFKFESKSLSKGSLYHKMVLEPEDLYNEYIKEEFEGCKANKNSKAYKEGKAKFEEENKGKIIVSAQEWEDTEKMCNITKTIAGALLDDTINERAFLWNNEEFDEILKCKVDALNLKYGIAIDLKTIGADATNEKDIQKAVIDYKYYISAAFYLDILNASGLDINKFVLIFQSTQKPYYCLPYVFSDDTIEIGRREYRKILSKWVDFRDNGKINVVKELNLPNWYIDKLLGA